MKKRERKSEEKNDETKQESVLVECLYTPDSKTKNVRYFYMFLISR